MFVTSPIKIITRLGSIHVLLAMLIISVTVTNVLEYLSSMMQLLP